MSKYNLVFDEIILKQLKKLGKQKDIKDILSTMFDKIELLGPQAGKIIDSKLYLYEYKNKHPPIRLYFKIKEENMEIYIFQYHMKTSKEQQQEIINKIKVKLKS